MKSDILIPKCTKGRGRAGITDLRRIPKKTRIILTPSLKWINHKAVVHNNRGVEKGWKGVESKIVRSWEMDLQRLKCLRPLSSLLSLIMLQIILKIILEIIWEIYWQILLFNLCWNQLWKYKKRILKHRNHHPWICVFIFVAVSVTTFLFVSGRRD